LGEADRVPERIAQCAVDPVEALRRLLRELDARCLETLVRPAAVVGLEDDAASRRAFRHELANLLGGGVVVRGRPGDHQAELDVRLLGQVHGEKAHDAEVRVGVHDHPELADVELEGLVLIEYVDEGVADSLEHGRHAR
jgi:hypothetical protein